ncbi:MAG: hypothetical protein ACOZE5_11615 [Verrucomicrobiota bacterium]
MRTTTSSGRSILGKAAIGFAIIIALIWAVEIARLPHLLYGEAAEFRWLRVLFRTAVVLAIWVWFHVTTRRLLRRLHELEGFLLVCSWCRRVGHEDRWLTMEEYFGSRLATETSHGICPDCAKTQLQAHRVAMRVAPKK